MNDAVEQNNISAFRKTFSRASDNPRIEVLRFSFETGQTDLYSFYASAIHHLKSAGENESLIVLHGGDTFKVALSHAALAAKIDEGMSPVDLREFCEGEEEALKDARPGQKMPDGTVYLGRYTPKDRDGNSLSKTFNVFAAPNDLPKTMAYVEAIEYVAGLKNWNGYDGTNYPTDEEIYAALKDGSYNGGWIIPPHEILCGKDTDGGTTTPDNLYACRNGGAFKGTFRDVASGNNSIWYWSSTENRVEPSHLWNVRFSDGKREWNHNKELRLSCRPVRLVPA